MKIKKGVSKNDSPWGDSSSEWSLAAETINCARVANSSSPRIHDDDDAPKKAQCAGCGTDRIGEPFAAILCEMGGMSSRVMRSERVGVQAVETKEAQGIKSKGNLDRSKGALPAVKFGGPGVDGTVGTGLG